MQKPTVSLLMTPGLEDTLFSEQTRNSLAAVCDVQSWQSTVIPQDTEILLASWGAPKLDQTLLAAMPNLKMVAYGAGTVKKIVTEEFWQQNIPIVSAAAANAVAVAEYTVSTMVFLSKNIRHAAAAYVDDDKETFLRLRDSPRGFNGLNVGLVGASYVGREVIRLLKSYAVTIAVYDPYLTTEEADTQSVTKMELNELMSWADMVSVHAPKLPETVHLVGREQLMQMQTGSFFINTARGTIVDYDALAEITPGKHIEVVIDVTDPNEPLAAESPLRKLPNVFITPHIAGSRGNEQQLMGELAIAEITRFVAGQSLRYQVRKADLPRIA